MSEQKDVQQLLKQGIEAAREGKRAEARQFFEQVVELDEKNEKGWYFLAAVVDTDEEKRICLSNVLQINPNNERAQKAMEKLQDRKREQRANEEVIPGITRRQLLLFGGGGIGAVLLILIIFLVITGSQNAQNAAATQVVVQATLDQEGTVSAQLATSAAETATQQAVATPTNTPTNTPALPTLPPEFTATPSPTVPATAAALPPPPANLQGSLAAWSGDDPAQRGFLPIVLFAMNAGGRASIVGNAEGRDPDISMDGQRVLYTRYFPTTSDFGVELINANGSDPKIVAQGLPILKPQMPTFCPYSNLIVFVALPSERLTEFTGQASPPYQVYTLNLDNNDLQRITNDEATYSYPAFSPDCTRIAVVRNDERGAQAGADIYLIELTSRTATPVTNDLDAFVETTPRWSPDSALLVYAAHQANEPNNNDIVIRPTNSTGTPLLPVRDPADDVHPVFSSDGRYIAFASNRGGNYDIYIFDQLENNLFQLTNSPAPDYPGGWSAQ